MPRKTYTYRASELRRTTLTLTAEMNQFLKNLGERCKGIGSPYFDKTQIVRALILALMRSEGRLDLRGLKDEADLANRIAMALSKR